MTCRTAREFLDVVFGDKTLADFLLIGWRLIVDAENRVTRPDEPFRIAMAVQAPLHLQRFFLPHERHAIDLAMARRAADPLVHVNAVIEVDEIWKIVNTCPLDGPIRPEAFADRLEVRARSKNLRMAVHAGLGRRDARKG